MTLSSSAALLNHADLKRPRAKRRSWPGRATRLTARPNRTESEGRRSAGRAANRHWPVFTRDEVSAAVNAGTDLVTGDSRIYVSDHTADLINLVVNAALTRLDNPPRI